MTPSAGAERQRVSGFGRLDLGLHQASDWYLWGPYLSERQWGTVREDYSPDGDAWNYLPHDHARSRAYRWGEDGLAGFCDIEQRLCVAVALWNGRFRDTMRDWWRSHDGLLPDFATRLCGSADIYDRPDEGRRPSASVNFVTVHDGFTLNDLVSYNGKHNEANTEDNRDGTDDNRSWNCGAEGPTGDADVLAVRARQKRAFLVTLLLSAGVPLLLGGDELGRTQSGNNNAYCQDNEITWFDWLAVDEDLLGFTKELIALRRGHPVFRRRRYLTGKAAADLRWFTPVGVEMTPGNWSDPNARSVALFINGATDPDVGTDGTPMVDDDFLILVNAWWEPLTFTVPVNLPARRWDVVCDTFDPARKVAVAQQLTVGPRSTVILQSPSSAASGVALHGGAP